MSNREKAKQVLEKMFDDFMDDGTPRSTEYLTELITQRLDEVGLLPPDDMEWEEVTVERYGQSQVEHCFYFPEPGERSGIGSAWSADHYSVYIRDGQVKTRVNYGENGEFTTMINSSATARKYALALLAAAERLEARNE